MPVLEFESTIAAPLEKVWAFHQDVQRSLPALSPPGDDVQIESADLPVTMGSRIVILAKGPLGRIRWVARIIDSQPPHAVVFGEEARFVDEQESGPFKLWRHEHEFERIDGKTTRLLDRITYRVPLGPIGWIGDWLIVRRRLRAMFKHRHAATRRLLESVA
jgi:ligand-binding SRPBCC domain-containing protein